MLHISQFYPCSDVKDACELYYICELGKYLHFNYKEQLSIDGVVLHEVLASSILFDYFRLAIDEGWVTQANWGYSPLEVTAENPLIADTRLVRNVLFTTEDVAFDREDKRKRDEDFLYAYRTPILTQVSFEDQNDEQWLWSIGGKDKRYFNVNNKSFCTSRTSSQNWLSLVAYVAVERMMTGSPKRLLLEFGSHVCQTRDAIAYLAIMDDSLNCLKNWCYYYIDESVPDMMTKQLSYVAWIKQGEDMGYHSRWYSGKEKMQWCKDNDIQVGDLMMLYEREMAQKIDTVSKIAGCRLVRVDELREDGVRLTAVNCLKTRAQGIADWNDYTTAVKAMFCGKYPYERLTTSSLNLFINDVGFEHLMLHERYFLVPLDKCEDGISTLVDEGVTMELTQNDFVYWVLKDYDFSFNEARFLDKYFSKRKPAYITYHENKEGE